MPKSCNRKLDKKFKLVLNSGYEVPMLGLGTWNSSEADVGEAVRIALLVGYRHFDCAHVYRNEHIIGPALSAALEEQYLDREQLFITSKLWNTFHRPDLVCPACYKTLTDLDTSYLDLYLMHWPMAFREGGSLFPRDACKRLLFSKVSFIETWKEMEQLVKDGRCRSIGVANFNEDQLEVLLENCEIPPAVNQIECHPFLTQKSLMEFCKSKCIAITAYCPLGSPNNPGWKGKKQPIIMEESEVERLAFEFEKTAAQILIRYQLQRGNIVIPKSVNKDRITSNFDIEDFELSKENMSSLDEMNRDFRFITFSDAKHHPDYPFVKSNKSECTCE
ncbi:aldo-keto reductase family 1 member B1-like isoform X2 [Teleopsis dalmanni]|nr:aldo-keto reductase family 1 member B1-like isoform X2 [Teleopsis dalmanni]